MEKIFYIALYLMGVDSKDLIEIINKVPKKELKIIFTEDNIKLQYEYNIDLSKHAKKLIDSKLTENYINEATEIVNKSRELGIKIIPISSKYYPNTLKQLDDAPAIIYIKGNYITKRDEKSIACVGSRSYSTFGANAVNSLVSVLTNENFAIISGLAEGIDTEAHKVCLRNRGRTIAVLAHGLDQIYPKVNKELAEEILNSGGTLVSEYPVGTKIEKYRFVKRNRIIAGLSKCVILFESKIKSGSMHTVKYALNYNKKIFCPYPTKYTESVSGLCNLLDDKKAIPLKCRNDYKIVIHELGYKLNPNLEQTQHIKNESFNKFININSKGNNLFKDIKELECNKYSGIKTNKETYEIFKKILKENNLSIREFFNAIILAIVNSYNGGRE